MTSSVDPHGQPLLGQSTTSSTGRTAGAIESAMRFNGASEMKAKAIESIE